MSNAQPDLGTTSSPSANFEFDGTPYSGTWSEEHRHECELEELAMMSPSDLSDQIERIKSKRGEEAAQKLHIEAMQKRRDLVASGRISTGRPKPKAPVGGHGASRGGYNNAQRTGASQSGPFF